MLYNLFFVLFFFTMQKYAKFFNMQCNFAEEYIYTFINNQSRLLFEHISYTFYRSISCFSLIVTTSYESHYRNRLFQDALGKQKMRNCRYYGSFHISALKLHPHFS